MAGAAIGLFVFRIGVDDNELKTHWILALASAVPYALTVGGLVVLSRACGAFALTRWGLALSGHLPWRLMWFLDDAHRRGILRQSGTVYQFRHKRFHDHLATANSPVPLPKGAASR
jgi:hypothetical protein